MFYNIFQFSFKILKILSDLRMQMLFHVFKEKRRIRMMVLERTNIHKISILFKSSLPTKQGYRKKLHYF